MNDRQFATTQWSVVLQAGGEGSASADALAELCRRYWYPLYAHIRRRGNAEHDAQDLTQAFIAFLLEKQTVGAADPDRGRFRSFLLKSLNNFLANEHRAASAQKRGGGANVLSIDFADAEERYSREPSHEVTPQRIFQRRWAITVLDAALAQVGDEFERDGKGDLFAALKPLLVPGEDAPAYRDIGERFSTTDAAVKVAAVRLRKRYAKALRKVIAETVESSDAVDEEMRQLMDALGN